MLPSEVSAVGEAWMVGALPEPQASPRRAVAGLVGQGDDGRLALNPAATAELGAMRSRIRELALARTRVQTERAWHREREKKFDEERAAELAARLTVPDHERMQEERVARLSSIRRVTCTAAWSAAQ